MIKRDASVLMVIDIQTKLAPAIENVDRIVANTTKLLNVADVLGVPIMATEQYPKGLGHTIDEIVPLIPDGAIIKKEH